MADLTIHPIETLYLSQIRIDPRNFYEHSADDTERLERVMSKHGNLSVICVDVDTVLTGTIPTPDGPKELPTYELVGGEARLSVYRARNVQRFPVIMAKFETREDRDAAAVALNQGYGTFNEIKLAQGLKVMADSGYDLKLSGIEDKRLVSFLASNSTTPPAPTTGGIPESYGVVVECESEAQQVALLGRLDGEGFRVRALMT